MVSALAAAFSPRDEGSGHIGRSNQTISSVVQRDAFGTFTLRQGSYVRDHGRRAIHRISCLVGAGEGWESSVLNPLDGFRGEKATVWYHV